LGACIDAGGSRTTLPKPVNPVCCAPASTRVSKKALRDRERAHDHRGAAAEKDRSESLLLNILAAQITSACGRGETIIGDRVE